MTGRAVFLVVVGSALRRRGARDIWSGPWPFGYLATAQFPEYQPSLSVIDCRPFPVSIIREAREPTCSASPLRGILPLPSSSRSACLQPTVSGCSICHLRKPTREASAQAGARARHLNHIIIPEINNTTAECQNPLGHDVCSWPVVNFPSSQGFLSGVGRSGLVPLSGIAQSCEADGRTSYPDLRVPIEPLSKRHDRHAFLCVQFKPRAIPG